MSFSRVERKHKPRVEADPRFPSGPWKGFWIQRGWPGRQWMRLGLTFCGGKIVGEGRDIVGPFTLTGEYDLKTGRCTIHKHYVGRHSVVYRGYNDGEGLWLWGTWQLPLDCGGFHIWPEGEADPTGTRLKAEHELPIEQEQLLPV